MNVLYPAQITFDKSDNRFFVKFLDIPEAITEGETEEEAFFNGSEALTLAIEGRLEDGMEVSSTFSMQKPAKINFSICKNTSIFINKMGKVSWRAYNFRDSTKPKYIMASCFKT